MFTLKFFEHGTGNTCVVCGYRYNVEYRNDSMKAVIVHKDISSGVGTEFMIEAFREATGPNDEIRGYATCFVENLNGKTIDRIGPIDSHPKLEVAASNQ